MSRKLWLAALALGLPIVAQADTPMTKGTQFTVRIENVSTTSTLRSMSGMTAPAPNSPGLWVVQSKPARLFHVGKPDLGWGLESQAEDGDPAKLAEHCMHHEGVIASGVFNTPLGDEKPGPALPGKAYEFMIPAKPGDRLAFTTMFGQSNDLFFAPGEAGIALFDSHGRPKGGDLTAQLALWDAGTEVNEEPGFGPNQAPRQSAPNTGPSEKRAVGKVKDAFRYPKVSEVLKVTLTPMQATAGR
jgi:hypothetical protein